MLTTPHTLVAAALVKLIPYPSISLPLSLLSHFFLDFFVIHWNPHIYTEMQKKGKISKTSLLVIIIDTLVALSFCLFILLNFWPDISTIALFAGAIFLATLPDTIEIPYYFFNYKAPWMKKYIKFEHEKQSNGSFFWGILTQIITITLSLYIFFS